MGLDSKNTWIESKLGGGEYNDIYSIRVWNSASKWNFHFHWNIKYIIYGNLFKKINYFKWQHCLKYLQIIAKYQSICNRPR